MTLESKDYSKSDDAERAVRMLLARLPPDPELWASLTSTYTVDIYCGLFSEFFNRGFAISPDVSKLLSDRQLKIGFDVYFEP